MRFVALISWLGIETLGGACRRVSAPELALDSETRASPTHSAYEVNGLTTSAPPSPTLTAAESVSAWTSKGTACGPLACRHFRDASSAFQALLELQPKLLALGETHALRGKETVQSATERFRRELLPLAAAAGAQRLLVELVQPPRQCEAPVAQVKQIQAPVLKQQQTDNQSRFLELGSAAKNLGVTPYLLEPSCDEFKSVQAAGEDGIAALLTLITSKSETLLKKLLARTPEGVVLAYGGAMHNNTSGPYAFGSALLEATEGRYLALDLIVPEFIQAAPPWQTLAWYNYYDASEQRRDVTVFRTDEFSYTLVFAFEGVAPPLKEPAGPK